MWTLISDKNYIGVDSSNMARVVTSVSQAKVFPNAQKAINYHTDLPKLIKKYDWELLDIETNDIISIPDYKKKIKYELDNSKIEGDTINCNNGVQIELYDIEKARECMAFLEKIKSDSGYKTDILNGKLKQYAQAQQDILHYIEKEDLDEAKSVKIVEYLQSVRQERRKVKNTLLVINTVDKAFNRLDDKTKEQLNCTINKKYNTKQIDVEILGVSEETEEIENGV